MISNGEIASHLYELARLTTLAEGNSNAFRVRAYETAARAVDGCPDPVAEMGVTALTDLRGVGASTAKKIRELVDNGHIERLEALREEFPAEFVELTKVPGVGPKTAVLLRDELGVESVDALRGALEREEVRSLPGLGAKTEQNIVRALDRLGVSGKERRTPIIEATRVARDVAVALGSLPGVVAAEPMGSLRRFRETIGDVDVLVASTGDPAAVMDHLVELPLVRDVVGYGARKTAIVTAAGLQIDVRVVRPEQLGSAQMYFTGSKAHNIRLRQMAIDRGWILNEYGLTDGDEVVAADTEEAVYAALGLSWISPELREDAGEIEAAQAGELPELVSEEDLQGDGHVHTSLSGDGRDDLESMVAAAKARGYTYLAITDHAEDLAINGASRDQMFRQRESIVALRAKNRRMRILHGAELNIGRDGSVDYDPEFLAGFDWGVASVHSLFDLPLEEQTDRVVTAMENPAVNVIGHLTGRRIGKRPGIELDIDRVLDAAERTRCALEINCHLDRLDAPVEVLRRAQGRDVLFIISTDAHDTRELANMRWGVKQARRGWVDRDQIVNTWDRERFLEWATKKRF